MPAHLVCVHGLAGSARWWQPALGRLADRRELRLLDLPRGLRPGSAAAWLAGELQALETPVDLVAHSLGAVAAVRLAATRPELVRRLVLVSPVGVPPGRRLSAYAPSLIAAVARSQPSFVRVLAQDALRTGPLNLVRGGLYAISADLRDDLVRVDARTLLVWGERDDLLPFRLAAEWERLLCTARVVALPRAGHVPMFDAPDELATAVEEFLDESGNDAGV